MCHDAGAQPNAVLQRPSNRAIQVKEVGHLMKIQGL